VEPLPDGAGAAVRALHETKKIVSDGGHEHEAHVDVVSEPCGGGHGGGSALRDMI
jgi:hypothetical protein